MMNQSELRAMVRDVLREALPQKSIGLSSVESVRLSTDVELADFVRKVLDRQEAIKAGQLKFTLASGTQPQPPSPGGIITGVVTEHVVDKHAGAGTLVLANDAVITPLARDRARKLNLKIERRR
jgi:hypothetical protein